MLPVEPFRLVGVTIAVSNSPVRTTAVAVEGSTSDRFITSVHGSCIAREVRPVSEVNFLAACSKTTDSGKD